MLTTSSSQDWGPHSLGKSIEWKQILRYEDPDRVFGPHSLGKSIEWKRSQGCDRYHTCCSRVPTRWGNQLNGNLRRGDLPAPIADRPHSLGKSIEWKRANSPYSEPCDENVPTRWGNQLNGNECALHTGLLGQGIVPTRWGNQLNGNQILQNAIAPLEFAGSHSLGKSIEWKPLG